jgi:hypothetical protein
MLREAVLLPRVNAAAGVRKKTSIETHHVASLQIYPPQPRAERCQSVLRDARAFPQRQAGQRRAALGQAAQVLVVQRCRALELQSLRGKSASKMVC